MAIGLAVPAGAQSPGAPTVLTGIHYADPDDQPQLLDVYRPAGTAPFPAVILVHGGGWQWGGRSNMASVAQYLAENGFVAFSIDYRLANTHRTYNPYPAAVEDVKAAIRWVRTHAAEYGFDPKRLGLLGSSAGAHLVSLVGMEGRGPLDRGTRVRAVVSWSGPQDMAELYRDGPQNAKSAVEAFTDCHGGAEACADILREISPVTYVDPTDPPLFYSNGTTELVPLPQATEMDQALTSAGVDHQFVEVPGSLHAQHYANQTAPSLPAGQTVLQASLAWLETWVARAAPNANGGPPSPEPSVSSRRSSTAMILVFVAGGVGLLLFAAFGLATALRRRARRRRREREWKEGQERVRTRTHSSSHSGSRSGTSPRSGRSHSPPSGSSSGRSR
jgi:acetyl esterase/lipase